MHHYRQTPFDCRLDYVLSFDREEAVSGADQSIDFQLIDLRKCVRNFTESLHFNWFNHYSERSRCRFTLLNIAASALWIAGIHEQRNARQTTNHILEQLYAFRTQVERHI